MNFIFAHAVMIHGAGVGTVGVQHGAAGVGVSIIDLTIIDIVRGDVLFGIRGDWPADATAFASPLPDEPVSAARTLPLAVVRVAVRKRVASFVIFIMVLLFLSLRWITFSNSASFQRRKIPPYGLTSVGNRF